MKSSFTRCRRRLPSVASFKKTFREEESRAISCASRPKKSPRIYLVLFGSCYLGEIAQSTRGGAILGLEPVHQRRHGRHIVNRSGTLSRAPDVAPGFCFTTAAAAEIHLAFVGDG